MTTTQEFLEQIANDIKGAHENNLLDWDIRAEVPNEEIEESKSAIAIIHLNQQDEIIQGNKTLKLDTALTGQIIFGDLTKEQVIAELKELEITVNNYFSDISYRNVLDAVLLECNVGLLEFGSDELYLNFTLPLEMYVQF